MRTYVESSKELPVLCEADVLVLGGGPAGVCAAIAAARAGKKTVLVERYGFLGGMCTAAGVLSIGGWQHDLDGRPLIEGLPAEIMRGLARRQGADPAKVHFLTTKRKDRPTYQEGSFGSYFVRVNPAILKCVLDDLVIAAGVTLYLHMLVADVILEGKTLCGVIVESKSGRQAVLAQRMIDCTGDADVVAMAGGAFEVGDENGSCQPMSQIFTLANAAPDDFDFSLTHDDSHLPPLQRNRYAGAVKLARERGELRENPNELLCALPPLDWRHQQVRVVNFTRVQNADATSAQSLTNAEIAGRRQALEALDFMQKYVPGCEKAYISSLWPQIGIRESRRIVGEYTLSGRDIQNATRFEDAIARGIYMIDVHNKSGVHASRTDALKKPYDIPYRALLPAKLENLLVAGRCISGDGIAMASYRIISHCMAMGQAAGEAAALSLDQKVSPKDIDVCQLQKRLEQNDANTGIHVKEGFVNE